MFLNHVCVCVCVCVCLSVPSRKPRFLVDWTVLVKEHIANSGIHLDLFGYCSFDYFQHFEFSNGFLGLCKPAYCAGGGPVAVAVVVSDR